MRRQHLCNTCIPHSACTPLRERRCHTSGFPVWYVHLSTRLIGQYAISAYTRANRSLQDVCLSRRHSNISDNTDRNVGASAFQYFPLACATHGFVIYFPAYAYCRAVTNYLLTSDNFFFWTYLFFFSVLTRNLSSSSFFFFVFSLLLSPQVFNYRNNVEYSRQDAVFPSKHRPGIQREFALR